MLKEVVQNKYFKSHGDYFCCDEYGQGFSICLEDNIYEIQGVGDILAFYDTGSKFVNKEEFELVYKEAIKSHEKYIRTKN